MNATLTLEEFPPVSTAAWDAAILKDQKGQAPKNRLFYRAEDRGGLEYLDAPPGEFPYTRGARANNEWSIREAVRDIKDAQAALDAGADEIALVVGDQDIEEVLAALPACAVHFAAGARAEELLQKLIGRGISGSVDYEPLGHFEHAKQLIRTAATPDFKPITVRAFRFAEAGATSVQELAFALAEGIEILAHIPDAAPAMAFSFAIGPDYFL